MPHIYNIYCDESGHLENDEVGIMVLGAVWCPLEKTREISTRLREIKVEHGLSRDFEIKWTKVSPAKLSFYLDVLDYFFNEDDLHFRALIAPKGELRHGDFNQSHDDWYYKMYYEMLRIIFDPLAHYRIYLDIKDCWGAAKVRKLHQVLSNSMYDFSMSIIERMQLVRSHEVELIQLADLLIGTVSYANRELASSAAKLKLVERMRERSRYKLTRTTLMKEEKVNLFCWHARGHF